MGMRVKTAGETPALPGEVGVNTQKATTYFLCGFLLLFSNGIVFPEPGSTAGQTDRASNERTIIVIFKGSPKDPVATVSLDGKGKGELSGERWLELHPRAGSHTVAIAGALTRVFSCHWGAGMPADRMEKPLQPASLAVTLAEEKIIYLLIERNRIVLNCAQLQNLATPLTDHTIRQIKAKDGEKFVKNYRAQVLKEDLPSAGGRTMIDMSVDELRQHYSSELQNLEFSPNQDNLSSLLSKIGERVQAFFQDFSDTASKESVVLRRYASSGRLEDSINRNFYYLILYHPNAMGPLLEEYRTDTNNNPVDQNVVSGFFMTSGYACLNLYFHPKRQQALRYRYLGREASAPHAYVVAFAEKLDMKDYLVSFTDAVSGKTSRLPMQGLAWVDPGSYQIVRLQTNLMPVEDQPRLTKQTTVVHFSEVKFEGAQHPLWLPHEVTVTSEYSGRSFSCLHNYSDYKLYGTKSDFKIEPPKSPRK